MTGRHPVASAINKNVQEIEVLDICPHIIEVLMLGI